MEVAHPLTDTETRILRKLVQILRDGIDDKDFTDGKGKSRFDPGSRSSLSGDGP